MLRSAFFSDRGTLLITVLLSTGMSLLALTTSFYMLQVYDRVLVSRSTETLLLISVIAVIAIAVFGLLDSIRTRILVRYSMRSADALAGRVLRAMIATSSQRGGVSARNGLRDLDTVRGFFSSPGFVALIDAPFLLIYLVVLLCLHAVFLGIVVASAVLLVGLAVLNQKLTKPVVTEAIAEAMAAESFAMDGLQSVDVLEGMGMSSAFVSRWRSKWISSLRLTASGTDRDSKLTSMSKVVRLLAQICLLGAGAILILKFRATGGIMIGASIIGARALAPIEGVVGAWKNVISTRSAWSRLANLLGAAPAREEGMALPTPQGRLSAVNVYYAVPQTRRTVLGNVSFELEQGEALGIIGPSGSGKSTLLRVLSGAWPCSGGVVRLDSSDIHKWPRAQLGPHIGYPPQRAELFSGTIRENIARMEAGDPEMVVRAAVQAHAHEMILALPSGYDTIVGASGHRLSGGETQRIAIARTFYGQPKLILLDEPNANLDGDGERALVQALRTLRSQGVSLVVVAHRPTILDFVDRILVLRANGTVHAFGERDEIARRFSGAPAGPGGSQAELAGAAVRG